jgi:hypothetical protein
VTTLANSIQRSLKCQASPPSARAASAGIAQRAAKGRFRGLADTLDRAIWAKGCGRRAANLDNSSARVNQ